MTTVAHSEYLGDVVGGTSQAFTNAVIGGSITAYPQLQLNAGSPITFPWLSTIANQFRYYEFLELFFEFQSTSATAMSTTSTNLGIIVSRYESNPTIPVDSNLQSLLNSFGHQKKLPYLSWKFHIPNSGNKLVRGSQGSATNNWGLSTNQDIRNYDIGWFNVATQNIPANSINLGQLHVHYKCQLHQPYYNIINNPTLLSSSYYQNTGTNIVTAARPLTTGMFAAAGAAEAGLGDNDTLPLTGDIDVSGGMCAGFSFPPGLSYGYYMVTHIINGSVGGIGVITPPVATRCTILSVFQNTLTNAEGPSNAVTSLDFINIVWVLVTAAGASLNYSASYNTGGGTIPTGAQWTTLTVVQVSPAMVNYISS